MNRVLFTIAIPVYNNIETIERAINSCLNQDYPDEYEVIIVDNNSDDGTYEQILKIDDPKLSIYRNKNTVTMSDNHNKCLEYASGDYIIFCHADDNLKFNALKILNTKIIERYKPEKYVVWGRSLFRDLHNLWRIGNVSLDSVLEGEESLFPFYFMGLTPSGTCYSRRSFKDIGGFVQSNHPYSPFDMTTMLYLALNGFKFEMINKLIFERTKANTANNMDYFEQLNALEESFNNLLVKLTSQQNKELFEKSLLLNPFPIPFYTILLRISNYRYDLIKHLIKVSLKNPKNILRFIFKYQYRYLIHELL